jgi:hypothetical protein
MPKLEKSVICQALAISIPLSLREKERFCRVRIVARGAGVRFWDPAVRFHDCPAQSRRPKLREKQAQL